MVLPAWIGCARTPYVSLARILPDTRKRYPTIRVQTIAHIVLPFQYPPFISDYIRGYLIFENSIFALKFVAFQPLSSPYDILLKHILIPAAVRSLCPV